MSIKNQLNPEQWKLLLNAPMAAATYISSASGGGLEMIKETFSAGKFIGEMAQQDSPSPYGELVDELVDAFESMSFQNAREESYQYEAKGPAALRDEAKQVVQNATVAVASLPGAEGYKRWIVDIAREVAETKTGGFMGIGAKSEVDEQERDAIAELRSILNV